MEELVFDSFFSKNTILGPDALPTGSDFRTDSTSIGPLSLLFLMLVHLIAIKVSAENDEYPSLCFWDIRKKPKCHGRTAWKQYAPLQIQFVRGIKRSRNILRSKKQEKLKHTEVNHIVLKHRDSEAKWRKAYRSWKKRLDSRKTPDEFWWKTNL